LLTEFFQFNNGHPELVKVMLSLSRSCWACQRSCWACRNTAIFFIRYL